MLSNDVSKYLTQRITMHDPVSTDVYFYGDPSHPLHKSTVKSACSVFTYIVYSEHDGGYIYCPKVRILELLNCGCEITKWKYDQAENQLTIG